MQIDRFDVWSYNDDNNCWDYVREFLISKGVPPDDLPKFGIHPDDKRSMTSAATMVSRRFILSGPVDMAIAAAYSGRALVHVGVVDAGMIRHVNKGSGVRRDTIDKFESIHKRTFYWLHKCLA